MAGNDEAFQKAISKGHSAAWDQQWDKAAVAYQQALEEIPDNPNALTSLGLAFFELQRFDESLLAYQKAVQVTPDDPLPLEKVGQLQEQLGKNKGLFRHSCRLRNFTLRIRIAERPSKIGVASPNWIPIISLRVYTSLWFMNALVMLPRLPSNIWWLPVSYNAPAMVRKLLK